jgi:hypothetical protein
MLLSVIQASAAKYMRSSFFWDVTQCVDVIPLRYELVLLINNQLTTDVLDAGCEERNLFQRFSKNKAKFYDIT